MKAGSFTRAAARLGLSKSVVSRHVSALEKELGVQLLYRSTHRLSLTEAGERFHTYGKDLESVAEQAVSAATVERERPRGLLRVTLPQTLVVSPVGPLITRFQNLYPEVQLDVRVTSLQVDPIEEGFDLALRVGRLPDSSLVCRKLRDVRFVAVAAPAYLKRHGSPRGPEELARHNCLAYSEFGAGARSLGESRKSARAASLSTNSGVLLVNALLAGQGIVIGPDLMFREPLKRGKVKLLFEDRSRDASALYALFPPGRFPSVSRKAFVDYLAAALAP